MSFIRKDYILLISLSTEQVQCERMQMIASCQLFLEMAEVVRT